MQNQQNAVIASANSEPKSVVVGIEDGTVLVTTDKDVVSNAPLRVVDTVEKRTGPDDRRNQPRAGGNDRRQSNRPRQVDHGPARGRSIGLALGAVLLAHNKSVEDFPKAPEKKGGEKQKDRRPFNNKGFRPKDAKANGGNNRPFRGAQRGK